VPENQGGRTSAPAERKNREQKSNVRQKNISHKKGMRGWTTSPLQGATGKEMEWEELINLFGEPEGPYSTE